MRDDVRANIRKKYLQELVKCNDALLASFALHGPGLADMEFRCDGGKRYHIRVRRLYSPDKRK